ncbi:MAG: peptidylprolyl isomerase, partial [Vibrionaceae bacterium]
MVTLHTNFGDIKLELFADKAPLTVENFLQYCRDGFYDNTLFHRVIDGFMIQGGGMTSGLKEKTARAPIKNEASNG